MKKRLLSLLMCSVLGVTALTGCGEKKETASTGPVEVEFWYSISGRNSEGVMKLVDDYNASQNEVKVNAVLQGDYYQNATKLQAALLAENQPDLVMLEVSQVGQFGKSNALADLTKDFSKEEIGEFHEGLLKNSYIDGKFMAVPFNRSTPILYVNKDILKKAGLDEKGPKNWDELKSFSKIVKDKVPGAVGFETPIDIWFIEAGIFQQNGKIFSDDEKKVAFNEEGKKILGLWQDMVKEGSMVTPPGQDYNAWDAAANDFVNGKVAMIQSSTAALGGILKNSEGKVNVGTAFLPAGQKSSVPTGGANLSVLAKSSKEKKDASVKFMKWLSKPENSAFFSEWSGYIPVTKKALEADSIKTLYNKYPQYKVAMDQLSTAATRPMTKGYREMSAKMGEEFKKPLVDTKLSVNDAVESAAKQVQELLDKNK